MNYKKFAQDNQKKLGYKIIEMNDRFVTIRCNECKAIKNISLKTLYRTDRIHNIFCSKYYIDICKKELGSDVGLHFHDFYRHAKERCTNPNNKDFKKYQGKFKFKDFPEFFHYCYDSYKEAIKDNYYKELSIDRIDGSKGYEPGNVRFVSMTENLQNKPYVRPVKMTNIKTGEVIETVSIGELARKYRRISDAGALHRALKNNKIYKKEWKIEYIET